jgi:hypothetical protein
MDLSVEVGEHDTWTSPVGFPRCPSIHGLILLLIFVSNPLLKLLRRVLLMLMIAQTDLG